MNLSRVSRRARATAGTATARWLAALLALVVLSVTVAYTAGARANVMIVTAEVFAGEGQASARGDDGWYYAIPFDAVLWTDANGSEHDRGRADCLPATGTTGRITFAAVSWSINGTGGRNVVWIYCRK